MSRLTTFTARAGGAARRIRIGRSNDLPLAWKLLLPFVIVLVAIGSLGTFIVVRDLSAQAQTTVDRDAAQASLDARSTLHDRELYLLESANFTANLQGMAAAVEAGDSAAVARLLQSVVALKTNLDVVAVTTPLGFGVADFTRGADGRMGTGGATAWAGAPLVTSAVAKGATVAGFIANGGHSRMAIATPVCSSTPECRPVGVAVVAIGVDHIVSAAAAQAGGAGAQRGVAFFDAAGASLGAASGAGPDVPPPPTEALTQPVRNVATRNGQEIETLYEPFTLQGTSSGVVAVALPTAPAFDSVRGAAARLVIGLIVAIFGVVVIGALVSRLILRQVRVLVATNRALGSGDLSARVPVLGHDELGELAAGVNQMAEQLEATYETLETRVEQRTEEVRRLLRDRTEFFAGLSHELRTPLAVIRNQAEMLSDTAYADDHAIAENAGRIITDCSAQVLSFVNDILELAKMESGSIELEPVSLDLREFLASMAGTIEALGQAGEVATSVNLPPASVRVAADPRRLREIVINLVDNAVKYTPARGSVEVGVSVAAGGARLFVSDTGVGIPADVGERVFDPFFRVKGSEPQHGQESSGLGLALTKRLVDSHGGRISFAARPGGGTTFTVTLPLLQPGTPNGHRHEGGAVTLAPELGDAAVSSNR